MVRDWVFPGPGDEGGEQPGALGPRLSGCPRTAPTLGGGGQQPLVLGWPGPASRVGGWLGPGLWRSVPLWLHRPLRSCCTWLCLVVGAEAAPQPQREPGCPTGVTVDLGADAYGPPALGPLPGPAGPQSLPPCRTVVHGGPGAGLSRCRAPWRSVSWWPGGARWELGWNHVRGAGGWGLCGRKDHAGADGMASAPEAPQGTAARWVTRSAKAAGVAIWGRNLILWGHLGGCGQGDTSPPFGPGPSPVSGQV